MTENMVKNVTEGVTKKHDVKVTREEK